MKISNWGSRLADSLGRENDVGTSEACWPIGDDRKESCYTRADWIGAFGSMTIRSKFYSADSGAEVGLAAREFFSYAPGTTCQRKCCWMKSLSFQKCSRHAGADKLLSESFSTVKVSLGEVIKFSRLFALSPREPGKGKFQEMKAFQWIKPIN